MDTTCCVWSMQQEGKTVGDGERRQQHRNGRERVTSDTTWQPPPSPSADSNRQRDQRVTTNDRTKDSELWFTWPRTGDTAPEISTTQSQTVVGQPPTANSCAAHVADTKRGNDAVMSIVTELRLAAERNQPIDKSVHTALSSITRTDTTAGTDCFATKRFTREICS